MDLGLKGKRALVTGASAGLGAAAAMALAAEGAVVAINSRSRERLQTTAERIAAKAGHAPAIVMGDVSKDDDVRRITEEAGPIDILISNAGGPPPGQFLELPREQWREAADLVLFSAINLVRSVMDHMLRQRWGRVIFLTSVGVLQPIDELILSNSFRSAVTGLCKTLSNNYARDGVTFNCICPGYTATERLQSLAKSRAEVSGRTPQEVLQGFAEMIPARRVGQPDELGALVAFLAGEKAAYITGASIPIDGGFHKGLL